MKQQILKDLNWRYTTKGGYDSSKRISDEDFAIIKEALHLSASSINSQPWKFIIIESDEAKQRFAETLKARFPQNLHTANASHIVLFANKTHYNENDYKKSVEAEIKAGRVSEENVEQALAKVAFAKMFADENGYNGHWTKAQTYIALGNVLHVLARLKIDSTPMEGVDAEQLSQAFEKELAGGYECSFALAMGYHNEEDFNLDLPKARLEEGDVFETI